MPESTCQVARPKSSRAIAIHNDWALRQWEIYHERQAQYPERNNGIDLHLEGMIEPVRWDDAKKRWEARNETGN